MSVVVPAYNEERAIGETVTALRAWLEANGRPWEILVVDNASEDATRERLEPLLDGERVRLLVNEQQPRQGLLGPARDARHNRRAAAALRR